MPGVPFSKACETCKKRRVKCDELLPCTPCLRLGRDPCPGYIPNTKFVDEGPRIRRKRTAAGGDDTSASSVPAQSLPSRVRNSRSAWKPYHPRHAASNTDPPGSSTRLGSRPAPRSELMKSSPRASYVVNSSPFCLLGDSSLVRQGFEILMLSHIPVVHCGRLRFALDIVPGCEALPRTLRASKPVPSYVWYLPPRIGQSQVLDSALDLAVTASAYLALPGHDSKASMVLMKKLGVAVAALKAAISDPDECMSADVLAAVSLLSSYECIKSTHAVAWMNHHKGLYRLLEKRGPARYRSDFERQLLLAAIGVIFTISLREDYPCFLEKLEWQAVFANKPSDSIIAEEWIDSWRCLPLMCLIPRIVTACREIVRDTASQTVEKIEELVISATQLRASFLDMAEAYGWKSGRYSPVLAPRNASRDDWRLFNDLEDQRAANYGNYLSALVILNRVIFAVRPSATDLEEESRVSSLEVQYLHTFVKTEPLLRKLYLVHAERVALSILLTSAHWASGRTQENGNAFDPGAAGGGNIIERWKFDSFDDILCARSVSTDLMFHYPVKGRKGSSASTVSAASA